jgi:polyisoprenoid-binding protein YceI
MNSIIAFLRASFLVLFVSFVVHAFPTAAQTARKIDAAKSSIRFVSKQMGVPVEGRFRKFEGTVAFDPSKPEATRASVEVELASIDLGGDEAEVEVKRPAWFDTARFPQGRFTLASLKPSGAGKYEAAGTLSLKGVSQSVVAPVTLAEAGGERTIDGQLTVKRLQFRIGEGPWSDVETVADEVLVKFHFVVPAR